MESAVILIRSFIVAFVAGAMSGLALPPIGLWWILAVTFPLFLWQLTAAEGWRRAFALGLALGLGYFTVAFHWIGFAFLVDAEAYLWMMPFAVGGLALFMAFYWAAAVTMACLIPARTIPRHLSIPMALAAAEWLRGHLFTGFPWAAPGLFAEGMGSLVQVASLVGMPGLTLLVLLWAAMPFAMWSLWRGPRVMPHVVLILVIGFSLPGLSLWGSWRLSNNPTLVRDGVVVRVVQPNVAQSEQNAAWGNENAGALLSDLIELSTVSGGLRPSLVVWPEASLPFLLDEEPVALQRIGDALQPGQLLLAGSLRRGPGPDGAEPYYTSILAIDDNGAVRDIYDKWRLVPGGEYLPLEWLLAPLGFRKVVSLPESLTAGSGPASMALPGIGQAGMLICYEAIFPHRLVASKRPDLIVNVTNDGWFGNSVGPYQHLAQVRLRAIEQGVPILRAANTGISAVIDPLGRVLTRLPLGTRGHAEHALPHPAETTFYSRYGEWTLLGIFSALLIICGLHSVLRKVTKVA